MNAHSTSAPSTAAPTPAANTAAGDDQTDEVLRWLQQRGVYDPRDFEEEGPCLTDLLDLHEAEMAAQIRRCSPSTEAVTNALTAARDALRKFGRHDADCCCMVTLVDECDCGFRAAVEGR